MVTDKSMRKAVRAIDEYTRTENEDEYWPDLADPEDEAETQAQVARLVENSTMTIREYNELRRKKEIEMKLSETKALDPALDHVIIMQEGYWGRGKDVPEALKNFNPENPPKALRRGMTVHACTAETRYNENGALVWKKDTPAPIKLI